MNRAQTLAHLETNPETAVLIVGAGVNGIGVFRELALQGVNVLLVDRSDFCSGASAASSHMVHGGIRYLENGEFRLVREAVQERNRLLQNAPHLVQPLPTVFPIFKWFSGLLNAPLKFLGLLNKPSERGVVIIKLGMSIYDAFTRRQKTVPRHMFYSRRKTLVQFPELNPATIFAGKYFDAAMPSPERICMELIGDAFRASDNARALNYMSLSGIDGDTVILEDQLDQKTYQIKPKLLINAAGPWIDFVNHELKIHTQFIGGTKGSHLILDHPELSQALNGHEFFFENQDGRIVLIYPLHDKVMIGTSDIRIEHPDEAVCTEEEIDYFFAMVKRVFPDITLTRDQIIFRFSGVRPLPHNPKGKTAQISRDHKIEEISLNMSRAFPIFSLIGGKWTTFRAFAEHTADKALAYLGVERQISTRDLPIGGGKYYHARIQNLSEFSANYSIDPVRFSVLFTRYGNNPSLFEFVSAEKDRPVNNLRMYSTREVTYLVQTENVIHLDDLILRRTIIAILGLLNNEVLEDLAKITADTLGWGAKQTKEEIARTKQILKTKHGVEL